MDRRSHRLGAAALQPGGRAGDPQLSCAFPANLHRFRIHLPLAGSSGGERTALAAHHRAAFRGARSFRPSLAVFVFSFTYSLAALGRIDQHVPQLPVAIAAFLSLANLLLFIYLIQWAGKALRPISVLTGVARETCEVIEHVYPQRLATESGDGPRATTSLGEPCLVVRHERPSGVLLWFDKPALMRVCPNGIVRLVPRVGDFVLTGAPLFYLYDGARADEGSLHRCVGLGPERTLEQDPAFGFRIIVDIAAKALSPAINDPTTAVLALDQLQDLLYQVGIRALDAGEFRDADGRVRLLYSTPKWEDFVCLAVTEIRMYGASNPQVSRRLKAMLEHLDQNLSPRRTPAIREQLQSLHRAVGSVFSDPSDRRMAEVCDLQGLGGDRESLETTL